MISENYINFAIVIMVQCVFFVVHTVVVGQRKNLWRYLGMGMVLGIPFGIVFDVVVGKFAGVFEYVNGFGLTFLIINGAFSYGCMMANVMLLQHHRLYHMYLWSVGLAMVYEIVNYICPVWEWTFGTPLFEYLVVVGVAYCGLAALMMIVIRIVYRVQFKTLSLFV